MSADTHTPSPKAAHLVANDAYASAAPRVSILIPFYKESPVALLEALERHPAPGIEIILLDDGSSQPELTHAVLSTLEAMSLPVRLISLTHNEGRARGRNRLTTAARGDYFLCLDADMLPDQPDFLKRWLAVIDDQPAVVFGGFSLTQAPADSRFDLHRLMAGQSDCLDAPARALQPEKYVFTSNLLIRRDVFKAEDFDASFTGWGWEDVEWAMRVVRSFSVRHIDNTATHMGLDDAVTLTRKYEQSVPNFARVVKKHPDVVAAYPSYKMARLIAKLPLHGPLRNLFKSLSLNESLPLKLRALALRFYRAALYAEVV